MSQFPYEDLDLSNYLMYLMNSTECPGLCPSYLNGSLQSVLDYAFNNEESVLIYQEYNLYNPWVKLVFEMLEQHKHK